MLQYHDSTWLHCISHTFVFDRVSLILFILSQACGPSWQRVRWTSKAGDSIFDRHSCRSLGDRCCVEVCRRVWLLLAAELSAIDNLLKIPEVVFFSPPHMFRQKLHTIHHNSMVFFSAPCWKSWVKVPFGGSPQALGLQRIVRQALWQAQTFKEQADASGAKLQVLA